MHSPLRILVLGSLLLVNACASPSTDGDGKKDDAPAANEGPDTGSPDNVQAGVIVPTTSFERPPYVALATLAGQTVALIGAHSKPDAAVEEANWLDDVWEYVSKSRSVTNGVILGDLNLACDYASADQLAGLDLRKDAKYKWLIPDDADTNVAATKCAYDRIIAVGDAFAAVTEGAPAGTAPKHSDHFPVGFVVSSVSVGAFNAKVFGDTKIKDAEAVEEAAQIICSYDITLVQEIVADDTVPADALLAQVKEACGADVEMKLSERVGTTSYKERFAYFYKSGVVNVTEAFLYAQKLPEAVVTTPDPGAVDPTVNDPVDEEPGDEPADDPVVQLPVSCGINQYVTPGGYCYATKDGKKKRVADSCCGI